jgi:hypothetical protein
MKANPKKKHLEKCYGKLPTAPDGCKWKVMDALEVRKVGQWTVTLASCGGYWHWGTPSALVNQEDEGCVTKPYFKAVKISKTRKLKNEIKVLQKFINTELKMSAGDPRLEKLKQQIEQS